MNEPKPIKVGIIGAGGVAIFHYEGYTAAGADIKAIADIDSQARKRRQQQWDIPEGYSDYHELLADPTIEAVSICLPNALHMPAVLAAAQAGKHILCEKPISLSLERGEAMIRACRDAGIILQIGHHLRAGGAFMKAKQLIDSGQLGRICYLRLRQAHDWGGATSVKDSFGKLANSGGGTLLDNGCHMMDLARFFGGRVHEVYAHMAALKFEIEVEDTSVVSLEFESGAFGTVENAWTSTGWENAFAIYGTEGTLEYSNRAEKPVLRHYFRDSPATEWDATDIAEFSFGGLDAHSSAVCSFLEAIRGEHEIICTGDDGLEAVRLVLAAYESARSGKPVTLGQAEVAS